MSLSLDTILTVASLVKTAVQTYQKITSWPDTMRKLGRRMKTLDILLSELEQTVTQKSTNAFIRLLATQKQHLALLLQDIRTDTEKVNAMFQKWENDIGPLGFQFRFKTLTQAYFALGSSSEKIAGLVEDVEEHLQMIRDYLQWMGFRGVILLGEGKGIVPGTGGLRPEKRKVSPSPSPAAPRRDFRVIFVDPWNVGRGVVGEAVMKLIAGWTKGDKGDWRIKTIHSAGLMVRNRSDVVEVVESVKKPLVEGGQHPSFTALAAVFANKNFEYPFKKVLLESMSRKTSIGVKKDIFKTYDLILVFTTRELDNMLKLKTALIEKEGKDAVTAKGKGRVLHLGSYLTLDGIPREIDDPKTKGKDAKVSRDDWNWKVAQIKLAVKEFLKQEMKWKAPAVKAVEKREEKKEEKKVEKKDDKKIEKKVDAKDAPKVQKKEVKKEVKPEKKPEKKVEKKEDKRVEKKA